MLKCTAWLEDAHGKSADDKLFCWIEKESFKSFFFKFVFVFMHYKTESEQGNNWEHGFSFFLLIAALETRLECIGFGGFIYFISVY